MGHSTQLIGMPPKRIARSIMVGALAAAGIETPEMATNDEVHARYAALQDIAEAEEANVAAGSDVPLPSAGDDVTSTAEETRAHRRADELVEPRDEPVSEGDVAAGIAAFQVRRGIVHPSRLGSRSRRCAPRTASNAKMPAHCR